MTRRCYHEVPLARRPLPRISRVFVAACFALGLGTGWVRAYGFAPPPAAVRMTVVGDSLALGTGASDPANGFAFRVYRALLAERPGSEVTNLAIGGSRAADVTRLQVAEIDPRSTLVLVVIGGNDVVRRTASARFAADDDALLAALRRRVPHAALVVAGVPDVARSPLFADSVAKTEALSRDEDRAARAAARRHGAAYVDLFDFTREHCTSAEFFSPDDFHPSDAGYEELARATLPVVHAALAAR